MSVVKALVYLYTTSHISYFHLLCSFFPSPVVVLQFILHAAAEVIFLVCFSSSPLWFMMGFLITLLQSSCCHRTVGSNRAVVIKTPCQKGRKWEARLSISSTLQTEQIQSTALWGFGFALYHISHPIQTLSFFFSSLSLHFVYTFFF